MPLPRSGQESATPLPTLAATHHIYFLSVYREAVLNLLYPANWLAPLTNEE